MNLLRQAGRGASRLLGHDSLLIRSARPTYNWMLDVLSGGKGVWQSFNGQERFRIDPRHRHQFPEHKDPEVWVFLRGHVRPGDVCLNVGAHVGLYALCLAHWSAPDGRVIAFEPNPTARAVLARHLAINGIQDRVLIRPEAVADAPGEATFCADGMEGVSRLGSPNPHVSPGTLTRVRVPVTTLDDFCARANLLPDWVTIDVEGYEIKALAGARQMFAATRAKVNFVVEMHPDLWPAAVSSREELVSLLDELDLELKPLEGQSEPLQQHGIVLLQARGRPTGIPFQE
jgi:FkbM family methyltransferase